mmetsp:Transcript_32136/g.32762  ORF Transcript_32136/g.32762 Transcript_32136/m.32762 type:complete len:636 (-) Transcript_32136:189-2096(-)|eukprot:CAMPEP_0182418174 /NCGR_PEP_ID=MMETSP1167-20130531/2644_1 /TAXON_ID=2988 /ORGANISM="Mallomonas Sp, Strain CCMP3275" /LENGTH=635 /DNA_ID=CAMNT_0024592229 /DNA_START=19 /DNA_END=1926 /DNA_ORIENTATION=+
MSSESPTAAAAAAAALKKDNFKKRQEDAKKKQNGELPPDLDENGKMINPHNPDYITKVPWYLGDSGPTLKHHTIQKVDHFLSMSEADELIQEKLSAKKATPKALGYRKGACKNCGAMSHKEKDCVERPRSSKKAAWKSGMDISKDEVVLNLEEYGKIAYDAKRDQWKGYDPEEYKETINTYHRIDNERRKFRQEQKEIRRREHEAKQEKKRLEKEKSKLTKLSAITSTMKHVPTDDRETNHENPEINPANEKADKTTESSSGSDSDSDSDYDSDEEEDEEDDTKEFMARDEEARDFQARQARQGGVGGAEMKTTVRNLRIREDTPKYLRNLDLNSAFYDPKTRSMRSNPLPDDNPEDLAFAGDNFVRHTGDALKLASTQVLCWEMQARGEDIDVFSNPSQSELLQRQFQSKKEELQSSKKKEILNKYGVSEEPKGLDIRLRLGQTEAYSQYSRDGRVVKGAGKVVARTKYEEDVYPNNHTSVWGSFYSKSRRCWGFACCHSLVRNSYCVGEKGKEANDSANNQTITQQQERKMLDMKSSSERNGTSSLVKRSDVFGESSGSIALDEDKLQQAMRKAQEIEERNKKVDKDERKRAYNSMEPVDVTPEDMEAFRRTRQKREDPMAALLDSEELLPLN